MKLALVLGIVVIAGTLMAAYGPGERGLFSLRPAAPGPHYLGYVEGETTLVAPPVAGRLVARPVERGDRIDKGGQLFVIDTTQAEAEVARAAARLAEFQARHSNLLTGKRVEEQDVIRAQRRQVEATLVAAEADLGRQSELVARNIVSRHSYDQAFANVAELRARVAALAARERAGDLAARQPEIDAAAAMVEQATGSSRPRQDAACRADAVSRPTTRWSRTSSSMSASGFRPARRWFRCCRTSA